MKPAKKATAKTNWIPRDAREREFMGFCARYCESQVAHDLSREPYNLPEVDFTSAACCALIMSIAKRPDQPVPSLIRCLWLGWEAAWDINPHEAISKPNKRYY